MSVAAAQIRTMHLGTVAPHRIVVVVTQDLTMTLVVPVGQITLALVLPHAVLMAEAVALVLEALTQVQVALVPLLQEVGVLLREVAKIDTNLK